MNLDFTRRTSGREAPVCARSSSTAEFWNQIPPDGGPEIARRELANGHE
jgi:hypothetical protein